MEIGKIPADILEEIVLKPLERVSAKRREIIVRPKTGEDCSVVDTEGELLLISSDPITGASANTGYMAVHINVNDIAACGGEPIGIMLTILLPPTSGGGVLEEIVQSAAAAAAELDIEIIGGHTEVTDAVSRPVVSGTVIGKTKNRRHLQAGGAVPGQGVIMTKWAGLEGTAIIAAEYEENLRESLSPGELMNAGGFSRLISVLPESRVAWDFGASAMHDATEGGVLGALWEMAEASGTGIEIHEEKIPIRIETKKICDIMCINPLRLISSGALIIASNRPEELSGALERAGINAAVIGRITDKERIIIKNGQPRKLLPPKSDELYKVKSSKQEGNL